jgi:predicted Zn-dependent peptidase
MQLDNGVHLLLDEHPGAETMTFAIGVKSGSLQDPAGKEGGAHLIEHMFFKGSKQRTAEQINVELDAMGGAGNATTGLKDIRFFTTVPNSEAKNAVDLFTDIFTHPNSTQKALRQEKSIVQQELRERGTRDAAFEMESQRLLMGDQPLSSWSGGTTKAVEAMKPEDIRNYVKNYFTGKNTVVLLSGDPSTFDLETVKQRLGSIKPGEAVNNDGLFQGYRTGALAEVVPDETQPQVTLSMIMPGVAKTEPDAAAADVLGMVMGAGFTGKFNHRLREQDNITYGAGGSHNSDRDYGVFEFRTDVAPENLSRAVSAMAEEATKAAKSLTDEEIDRAKRQARNQLIMAKARPGVTGMGALSQVLAGDSVESMDERIQKLDAVTPDQVRAVAGKLFDLKNTKWALLGPVTDTSGVQQGLDDAKTGVKLSNVAFDAARYEDAVNTATEPS